MRVLTPSAPYLFDGGDQSAYVENIDPLRGARDALLGFRDSLGERLGKAFARARGGNREILKAQMNALGAKTDTVLAAMESGKTVAVQGTFDALADFLTNDFLAPFMGYTRDGKRKLGAYLQKLWEGLLDGLDSVRERLVPTARSAEYKKSLKILGLQTLVGKQTEQVFHMSATSATVAASSAAAASSEEAAGGFATTSTGAVTNGGTSPTDGTPPPSPRKKETINLPERQLTMKHGEAILKSLSEAQAAFRMFGDLDTKTGHFKTAFQSWIRQLDPEVADFEKKFLGIRPLTSLFAVLIRECNETARRAPILQETERKLIQVFFGSICPMIALLPARSRPPLDVFNLDGNTVKIGAADYPNYSFQELPTEVEPTEEPDDTLDNADDTDEMSLFSVELADGFKLQAFKEALNPTIPFFRKGEPGASLSVALLKNTHELKEQLRSLTGPVRFLHLEEQFIEDFLDFVSRLQIFLLAFHKKAREVPDARPHYRLLERQFLEDIYPILERIPETDRRDLEIPFFVKNHRKSLGLAPHPVKPAPSKVTPREIIMPPVQTKSRWRLPATLTALAASALAVFKLSSADPTQAIEKVSLESEPVTTSASVSASVLNMDALMAEVREAQAAEQEPEPLPEGSIAPLIPDQPSSVWAGVHEALAACKSQGSTTQEINEVVEDVLAKNSAGLRRELEQHVWSKGASSGFEQVRSELQSYGYALGGAQDFAEVLHRGRPHEINQAASFFTTPVDHYGMIAGTLESPFVCP